MALLVQTALVVLAAVASTQHKLDASTPGRIYAPPTTTTCEPTTETTTIKHVYTLYKTKVETETVTLDVTHYITTTLPVTTCIPDTTTVPPPYIPKVDTQTVTIIQRCYKPQLTYVTPSH
ncbi:unnamed protein product [Meganyctiphanes norvegica]|uniref:Uncharacterized protein n=1 Tax=Meganyctiphanes norvegica TaxID=48144 RepID=A0AAV2SNG1_MEGNR